MRTDVRLPVEGLVFEDEAGRGGTFGPGYREHIDAIEIVATPFRYARYIAAVTGEYGADGGLYNFVFPGDQDDCVPVLRLLERSSQPVGIKDPNARMDGEAK